MVDVAARLGRTCSLNITLFIGSPTDSDRMFACKSRLVAPFCDRYIYFESNEFLRTVTHFTSPSIFLFLGSRVLNCVYSTFISNAEHRLRKPNKKVSLEIIYMSRAGSASHSGGVSSNLHSTRETCFLSWNTSFFGPRVAVLMIVITESFAPLDARASAIFNTSPT